MNKQLIYVANGDVSVYESQVIELLRFYESQGIKIYLIQGYQNKEEKSKLEKKLGKNTFSIVWVKSYPMYSFFEPLMLRNYNKALKSIPDFEKTKVHVRSEYMGYIFKKISILYKYSLCMLIDIRAIVYEELDYKISNCSGTRKILSHLQRSYMKRCYKLLFKKDSCNIAISSVSDVINTYIQEHFPACIYKKYFHPNIAGSCFVYSESSRNSIREKYDIKPEDTLAICSTGGNSMWQKDYLVIQRLIDLGIKVINLSRKSPGVNGCITTTVPFSEMPAMLSAADIAVLWRDESIINWSASPSKFSEFASMGIYVLHNGTVSVASNYINKTNIGLVTKDQSLITKDIINKSKEIGRLSAHSIGRLNFGVESIGMSYLTCLGLR